MATTDSPIPIIDFAPFASTSEADKLAVGCAIVDAMRTVGWVYLRGLEEWASKELVDDMFTWNKRFFALPEKTKMLAPHPPSGAHHRGYSAIGREKVSQAVPRTEEERVALKKTKAALPDAKESYEYGNETNAEQPNVLLPEDKLPGFSAACSRFYWACDAASKAVLSAIALGLSLPASYFDPIHSKSANQLRLLHYPAIARGELEEGRRARMPAHTDYTSITMLWQDDVGGLEVEVREGEGDADEEGRFIEARPVAGTVIVNTGDFLQRWTNDLLKSTNHRVRAPTSASSLEKGSSIVVPDRYSIPYFVGANPDTVVETIPSCITPGRPNRYEPVSARKYINERAKKNY